MLAILGSFFLLIFGFSVLFHDNKKLHISWQIFR